MAKFTALFPVQPAPTARQFLERVTDSSLMDSLVVSEGVSEVSTSLNHCSSGKVTALITYNSNDNDAQWQTSALIARNDTRATVRVETQPLNQHSNLFTPAKPVIVDMLLDCFGSDIKPPFKLQKTATAVTNTYVPHIVSLVEGSSDTELPVVYATAEYLEQISVDAEVLAHHMYGMAHVFLETDKHIKKKIQSQINKKDIGVKLWRACVLWPQHFNDNQSVTQLDDNLESGEAFIRAIRALLQAGLPDQQLSIAAEWSKVNNSVINGGSGAAIGTDEDVVKQETLTTALSQTIDVCADNTGSRT